MSGRMEQSSKNCVWKVASVDKKNFCRTGMVWVWDIMKLENKAFILFLVDERDSHSTKM